MEKILAEFHEPHYGYIRVNVSIKPLNIKSKNFVIEEKIKFFFWLNIAGICNFETVQGTFGEYSEYV